MLMLPANSTKSRARILQVDVSRIGAFVFREPQLAFLGDWSIELSDNGADAANLREATAQLRNSDVPVAFPTETVYGLAADATRSSAVRGIYNAKQRPSDNPLIVHISSLSQLRHLLSARDGAGSEILPAQDPIPDIYHPLITKFWPGPLTILLPLPHPSPLAPEVTNSVPTVAVRMPASKLALALIQLADVPLAAPSANTSSRPSPTTAAHVFHDLSERVNVILDGGPCEVGVESTVVDGLTNPPTILRPGGVSLDMLKKISGWEDVGIAYGEGVGKGQPRAPGMKYKHYSPNARVLLFHGEINADIAGKYVQSARSVGLLTTEYWNPEVLQAKSHNHHKIGMSGFQGNAMRSDQELLGLGKPTHSTDLTPNDLKEPSTSSTPSARYSIVNLEGKKDRRIGIWTISLGKDAFKIAQGLFSALRELDLKNVDVILVEGIDDKEGGPRAAIMNRLRKAAELEIYL